MRFVRSVAQEFARNRFLITSSLLAACGGLFSACGGEITDEGTGGGGAGGGGTCAPQSYETGDPEGHADPMGAKAAGQARAGRLTAETLFQPAHGRQQAAVGDFVLINENVAFIIENAGDSDGYGRFGGEVLAVDRVGADGRPLGLSYFAETLQLTSLYQVAPDSITIMNDGGNGEPAVVRVVGKLKAIPFLAETFAGIFPASFDGLDAAYEYVLAPGSEKLEVRFGFINPTAYPLDTGKNVPGSTDLLGFFQGSFSKKFVPTTGFGDAKGFADYVGFENASLPFAYIGPAGAPLEFGGIDISGFQVFSNEGQEVASCGMTLAPNHEIVVGEPGGGINALGRVVRRSFGEAEWKTITGVVRDTSGAPVRDAFVHVVGEGDAYLNRAKTDENGAYSVEVPAEAVSLVPQKRGFELQEGVALSESDTSVDLTLPAPGFIHVVTTQSATGLPMPSRIQVIPEAPFAPTPDSFGSPDETNGRLHQVYDVTGDVTIEVPPGSHRIVVSHGFEYEILDQTSAVVAGQTVEIAASLAQTVETPNALSADFHIHSMYSADSSDPVELKVRASLADGVEVPTSSEHEWIIAFQPTIEALGAEAWAFGPPGEELTTFTWGHFGVVGIDPKPGALNGGAIDWLGKSTKDIFAEVKGLPEHPALIVNHPSGTAAFSSYFTKVALDRETGTSTHELWDDGFDAVEVFNDSDFDANRDASVADWFALLNSGKSYWSVGSSDSHSVRTAPVGYPRTYLTLGYDSPAQATAEDVRQSIRSGRMTVSGGLVMTVTGPGGVGPGEVSPKTDEAEFTVTVACPSWTTADTLEVIVNGETVGEPVELLPVGAGPGRRYTNTVTVPLPAGPRAWVVFHAKGTDLEPVLPGRLGFAVSNPVIFE